MSQIIVEDPDLYTTKEVDGSGRIYLGKDWADKRVKVVIEAVREDQEAEEGNPSRPILAD